MNWQGKFFVFDLDDTLIWTPHWYEEALTDKEGYLVGGGRSFALNRALDVLDGSPFRLHKRTSNQLDKRNCYFLLVEGKKPAKKDRIYKYFDPTHLEDIGFAWGSRHTPHLCIPDDFEYYLQLDCLGVHGVNEPMMKLYRQAENKAILTARMSSAGMQNRIREAVGDSPITKVPIWTQPYGHGSSSGTWKGRVLADLAQNPKIKEVVFYDDNLQYIKDAQKVLDHKELTSKVKIIWSNPKDKPDFSIKSTLELLAIADWLDDKGFWSSADRLDNIIKGDWNKFF